MCYDVSYQLKRIEREARRKGVEEEEIEKTITELKERIQNPNPVFFHISGFDFGPLPVFTNTEPKRLQFFNWGLKPNWVKTQKEAEKIKFSTLNARSETVLDLPSFKVAFKKRRCLIMVDGFFEHHHKNGKTIPFFIRHKDDSLMVLAGIYEINYLGSQQESTVSILTTGANELMRKIHNNPKLEGARMPVILEEKDQKKWLDGFEDDHDFSQLRSLLKPYPDHLLEAHTVQKLKVGHEVINTKETIELFTYKELPKGVDSIIQEKQINLFD